MTDEPTREFNGIHRRQRRRLWLTLAATLVAFALLTFAITSFYTSREQAAEEAQISAENAAQIAEQVRAACDRRGETARELGDLCRQAEEVAQAPTEPLAGPAGPPPSDEQVAQAVAVYLAANPPRPGRPPTMQEIVAAVADHLAANPPEPGEPGPAPSDEQVVQAVAAFLLANPPPAGEDGEDGADSTVPGPAGEPGEPPLAWTFETCDAIGRCTTHRCERVDDFDPEAPRYECTPVDETEEP